MSTAQSIIVYRNPAEAMFWESGMAFPLMVALFVGFVVALAAGHFYEKMDFRSRKALGNWSMFIIVAPAVIVGSIVFAVMM